MSEPIAPMSLADEDFRALSRQLITEMDHLDGREWQEARDLYDECYRGRVYNSLMARIRVARALRERNER